MNWLAENNFQQFYINETKCQDGLANCYVNRMQQMDQCCMYNTPNNEKYNNFFVQDWCLEEYSEWSTNKV